MTAPSRGVGLASSAEPLAEAYDVALLDLDGVVHLVDDPVPGAAPALQAARAAGMRLAFVTNNASRAPDEVVARLHRWGIPSVAADVVTAAQAAVALLAADLPAGARVLVLGAQALRDEASAAGLVPVREEADEPAAVLQGLDRDLRYADLAEAALALGRGVPWVACNTDSTLPTTRGLLPGNGAMVAALATATGRAPRSAGKPETALHAESVRRTEARRPLVVGDRLDTDVLGAVRGGADSLAVLTGVVSLGAVLAAPPGTRPAYVSIDLEGLLVPHAPVAVGADGATCGRWSARDGGGGDLLLAARPAAPATSTAVAAGPGAGAAAGVEDVVAALRALCTAAWTSGAAGDVRPQDDAAAGVLAAVRARRPGA